MEDSSASLNPKTLITVSLWWPADCSISILQSAEGNRIHYHMLAIPLLIAVREGSTATVTSLRLYSQPNRETGIASTDW